MELASDQRVYYVHCNFCNTILAVSVPWCSSNMMLNMVTVRCGHCGNLLSVTMGASASASAPSLQPFPPSNPTTNTQKQQQFTCSFGDYHHHWNNYNNNNNTNKEEEEEEEEGNNNNNNNNNNNMCGSSSSTPNYCSFRSNAHDHLQQDDDKVPKMPIPRPPEKRQRAPSAYNRFIKEEIQRLKASNPDISHREAFSAAAKNWAHFPHIHFGLKLDGSNQKKLDQATVVGHEGSQESNGFY